MACYVDPAIHDFGRMKMCHLFADSDEELHAMADRIGVARRWHQKPPKASWPHYDVCKSKRALAVKLGAVEVDRYAALEHTLRLRDRLTPERAAQFARLRAATGQSHTPVSEVST